MHTVYLDHSATTPVRPEVLEAMLPFFSKNFGNASSVYRLGRESKNALEKARRQVASFIGAHADEIVFTGSGTEADNIAVLGTALANSQKGKHIITTSIEHHAVFNTCAFLEKSGYRITYLPVSREGIVNADDLANAVTDQTVLISVMHVNNEVGTIQPLDEISAIAKKKGILFHSDCVQSAGKIPLDVNDTGVDLLSLSAHKIYGPKGIGALYIRRGTAVRPVSFGGSQEKKWRPGTENVPAAVGFGQAAEIARRDLFTDMERIAYLRGRLVKGILSSIDHVHLNGHSSARIPGNANLSFDRIEGESLLMMLDMKNIAASSGSACTAGSTDPSHVLLAMGVPFVQAAASLRFSLGRENTEEEIDYVLRELPPMVERLRASFDAK